MATLHKVVKAGARLIEVTRRKAPEPSKAGSEGSWRDTGLTTRAAVVVLVGVAVGILVGVTGGVGAGLAAGVVAAAAVNGLIRPGS
jgi:hypothetical protein